MRISVATAAACALAVAGLGDPNPAEAHARHRAKHPDAWAAGARHYRPSIELPPGYSHGGPMYTTCDRINRDRMLVGTCR